jgi:cytochrome c biogenesis protein CcdA/glutaredoxin
MNTKYIKIIIIFILIFLSTNILAQAENNDVNIYVFGTSTCPYCKSAQTYFSNLDNNNINVFYYQLDKANEASKLFLEFGNTFNQRTTSVPAIFISNKSWIGFDNSIILEIENKIDNCTLEGCKDTIEYTYNPAKWAEYKTDKKYVTILKETKIEPTSPIIDQNNIFKDKKITLFGKEINLESKSLIINTIIISFIDGINPCSLWVLLFLLSIVIYSGSRKKVFLIGFAFLLVTAIVYGLFIMSVLNALIFFYSPIIKAIIVIVAIVFGLINIKDYFWYKKGISLTISDNYKPKLFDKIRNLMNPKKNMFTILLGTIILAAGVAIIEIPCTAGLPLLWANLVSTSGISYSGYLLLLLLYIFIYLLIEIVIFIFAVFTLKTTKFTEKHGKLLKLFSGLLIFGIGIVFLFFEQLLQNIFGMIVLLISAILLTVIINKMHKYFKK